MEIQTLIAFTVLLSHVLLLFSIFAFIASSSFREKVRTFADNFAFVASFLIALLGMLGSLYFSDIIGWAPCVLCWYQRIALYPLVVVFGVGVWWQDLGAKRYGIALSGIGLIISLYQIYLQLWSSLGNELEGFCSAVGATGCSEVYMREFGYITFPVLSATAFLYILLLQLARRL